MKIKNYYTLLLLVIVGLAANAQGLNNTGANIVVQNGAFLIVSGGGVTSTGASAVNNDGTIKLDGNWTNNSTGAVFTSLNTSGVVELNGASTQTIGGSNPTTFESLTLSGSGVKQLGVNNTVKNTLTLDGILALNSRTLIIDNSATTAIVQNTPVSSKHIRSETTDGLSRLQWNIGNSAANYRFPFANNAGDDLGFNFNVTTAGVQSGTGNVTVAMYPVGTNNTPFAPSVGNMTMETGGNGSDATVDRWWIIDANNYTTKPVSTMIFKYSDTDLNTVGNVNLTESEIKAQRWDGALWNAPDFFGGSNSSTPATNVVTVTNVSNYSPWVLHDGTGSTSPLPIKLLSFNAKCDNGDMVISWTTASEQNNDFFEIQRSTDGVNYATIEVIDGAGNSNSTLYYSIKDDNAPATGAYYRLKQTDFNGQFEVFAPEFARCGNTGNNTIGLYPNPANELTTIDIQLANADKGVVAIYNNFGQLVYKENRTFEQGKNSLMLNTLNLAVGQYFVNVTLENAKLPAQKLVITR